MPAGMPGQGGHGPIIVPAAAPPKLNIVVVGNSVAGANGGISSTHQPPQQLAANLTAAGRTFSVHDATVGGSDNVYWANATQITTIDGFYTNTAGWLNICILLETSDYIDDTRGNPSGGGDGLSLSDPTAAGQACYDLHVTWAQLLKAKRSAGNAGGAWLPVPVCPPDVNEPSSYASTSDNNNYRTARNHSNDLLLANTTDFWRVIDAYSVTGFHGTLGTPLYQNAGSGQWIHLDVDGGDLLGLTFYQGII